MVNDIVNSTTLSKYSDIIKMVRKKVLSSNENGSFGQRLNEFFRYPKTTSGMHIHTNLGSFHSCHICFNITQINCA